MIAGGRWLTSPAGLPKPNSQCYLNPTAREPPTDSHLGVAMEHLENTPRTLPLRMGGHARCSPKAGFFWAEIAQSHLLPNSAPLPQRCACQAAGTVSTGHLAKLLRKAQVSSRYDLGSTLELHRLHGKHNSLPRPSHHYRVYLTRGGQGHQRLRGKRQRS